MTFRRISTNTYRVKSSLTSCRDPTMFASSYSLLLGGASEDFGTVENSMRARKWKSTARRHKQMILTGSTSPFPNKVEQFGILGSPVISCRRKRTPRHRSVPPVA